MEKFDQQSGGFKADTHTLALANSLITSDWHRDRLR